MRDVYNKWIDQKDFKTNRSLKSKNLSTVAIVSLVNDYDWNG